MMLFCVSYLLDLRVTELKILFLIVDINYNLWYDDTISENV